MISKNYINQLKENKTKILIRTNCKQNTAILSLIKSLRVLKLTHTYTHIYNLKIKMPHKLSFTFL